MFCVGWCMICLLLPRKIPSAEPIHTFPHWNQLPEKGNNDSRPHQSLPSYDSFEKSSSPPSLRRSPSTFRKDPSCCKGPSFFDVFYSLSSSTFSTSLPVSTRRFPKNHRNMDKKTRKVAINIRHIQLYTILTMGRKFRIVYLDVMRVLSHRV